MTDWTSKTTAELKALESNYYKILTSDVTDATDGLGEIRDELDKRNGFTYEVINLYQLSAIDLAREALIAMQAQMLKGERVPRAKAYRITINLREGDQPHATKAEALYLPDAGRIGLAWGSDADWADVKDQDVAESIKVWPNDPDEFKARN